MTPSRPNRRTFLKSVALGAATLALDSRARADAGRKRAIKKSLKFGMIGEGATVKEKFAVARECGFDGVEMDSPSGLDLGEVLAAKAETGIEIPGVVDSVHWRDTLSDPDASVRARGREALVTALSDCRKLGGTTVLLVPAVVNAKVSYADAYARSQEEIRKVLPAARESGVKIAIENVWNGFLLSPLEAARYVDELGTEVVGWYFDVGNIVNFGWPRHWIEALGTRIVKLDVKEYSRKRRDAEGLWKGFEAEIGEGDCDWPDTMKALDAVSYSGWASAEVAGGGRERLADVAARMDRVLSS